MFRVLTNTVPEVEVLLDGEPISVPAGISVAAALIYLDALPIRHSVVSQSPRAAFCMMGACFECLLDVDGVNQRACQVLVQAGMKLRRDYTADKAELRS